MRKLAFKCDRFLLKLQSEENADDVDSNNDEMLMMMGESGFRPGGAGSGHEEDDDYTQGQNNNNNGTERKKRAKNMTKTNKLFYLKFVAGVMIVEAYFAYNFSAIKSFSSTTKIHVAELNMTATIEPYFWFTLNA